MIYIKIIDKNGQEKFTASGWKIETTYQGVYADGDILKIRLDGTNVCAVRLDSSLCESYIYLPDKSFSYAVPSFGLKNACYAKGASDGENHRTISCKAVKWGASISAARA